MVSNAIQLRFDTEAYGCLNAYPITQGQDDGHLYGPTANTGGSTGSW